MVKNGMKLQAFEAARIRAEKVDVEQNFRILDALYKEAAMLGAFPPADPLEGIEVKIRIAKAVNNVQKPDQKGRRRTRPK
ncbi:MAG: hypothetical protein FJY82_06025 [Candidatus Aminicenantes bacterium]|nr:hypothetical protein [Candidatus Aminicenantes bacterium]